MRYREVYNKCYLRDKRHPIRLLCFRKINTYNNGRSSQSDACKAVHRLFDYSCHTTFTWNKCKLVDTLSTIFPYVSKKISRKWQHYDSEYQGVAVCVPLSVFVHSTLIIFCILILFFSLFVTNDNLLFTITINNFSIVMIIKRNKKRNKKDAIQSRRPLMPYSLVLTF